MKGTVPGQRGTSTAACLFRAGVGSGATNEGCGEMTDTENYPSRPSIIAQSFHHLICFTLIIISSLCFESSVNQPHPLNIHYPTLLVRKSYSQVSFKSALREVAGGSRLSCCHPAKSKSLLSCNGLSSCSFAGI